MTVTTTDLQTYLGLDSIDADRAAMILDDVLQDALSVVTVGTVPATSTATWSNLPAGAEGVIRAAAGRVYLNAAGVTSESVGPFSVTRPAPSGSLLSRRERMKLRRLAGRGPAISVDTTPTTALATFEDALSEPTVQEGEEIYLGEGLA